jgi:hypothetical protein
LSDFRAQPLRHRRPIDDHRRHRRRSCSQIQRISPDRADFKIVYAFEQDTDNFYIVKP